MAEDRLRVLIVEDSLLTARMLREKLETQPGISVVGIAQTGQEGVRRATDLQPDVILMDIHLPDVDGIQATWLISSKNPNSSVIIVTSEARPEFMQRAMLAGAQAYVLKPVDDAHELADTIRTVRQRHLERSALLAHPGVAPIATVAPPQLGKRVAIFRAKGGQGATSVAVNLAVTLRALTRQAVVLVDFDLRFGDANILLDLPFERSIIDLLPHIDELDSDVFNQVLAKHSSGVQLLMRPDRAELAEKVSAEDIQKVLTQLPRFFDYVLVDCELSYDDKLLSVLDRSDSILLVLTPDLGAVRNTQYFLQLATTLGYPRSKIAFVLNRAKINAGLDPADVEQALGAGPHFRMDSQGSMLTECINMGTPVVQAQPRSDFAQVIRQIADYLRRSGNELG